MKRGKALLALFWEFFNSAVSLRGRLEHCGQMQRLYVEKRKTITGEELLAMVRKAIGKENNHEYWHFIRQGRVQVLWRQSGTPGLDLDIQPGKIYGLIGRNGAGKTTLLSILTAQNTHDSGEVTYNGEPVWENPKALADLCFSRELQATLFYGQNNLKVRHYLQAGATFYPRWDEEYARRLLKEFGVEEKKRVSQLSKGQLSMVTILIALASCRTGDHSG